MPDAVRRGTAKTEWAVKAWISPSMGRIPSRTAATADPAWLAARSARSSWDGFSSSDNPLLVMVNRPDSLVEPKRFLMPRRMRNW